MHTAAGRPTSAACPGPYGYKWSTLPQLHAKLFNEPFEEAHQALADVRAGAKCYFELKRRKVITRLPSIPEVA